MRVLLLILFFSTASPLWGQSVQQVNPTENSSEYDAPNDSSRVVKKEFQQATLKELKADPELNYTQPPTVAESLWDRFKSWIASILRSFFENASLTGVGRILLYTVGLIIIIVVILTLLKVNAFRVLYSGSDQNRMGYQVFHENIHEMDFEKLIREAQEKADYRLGTRLVLLYALKLLSDQHLIEWKAGKTNHDYVDELSTRELKTGLNEISFYFDYAWYGNFQVNADTFVKVQTIFSDWRRKLNA